MLLIKWVRPSKVQVFLICTLRKASISWCHHVNGICIWYISCHNRSTTSATVWFLFEQPVADSHCMLRHIWPQRAKTETGTNSQWGGKNLEALDVRRRAKPMSIGTKNPHKNHFCHFCCWTWTLGSGSFSPRKQSSLIKWDWVRGGHWGLELHGARRDVEHGGVKLLPLERRPLGVPALLQHLVNFLLGREVQKKNWQGEQTRSTGPTVPSRGHNGKPWLWRLFKWLQASVKLLNITLSFISLTMNAGTNTHLRIYQRWSPACWVHG